MPNKDSAIKILTEERDGLQVRINQLNFALKILTGEVQKPGKPGKRKWTMSAEARAKISAAQKKRWAKAKK